MTDNKRRKEEAQLASPDQAPAQATAAPLPPPPPAGDPLAGVGALKSGRGEQLRSPAAAQLLAALSLFDDVPGGSDTAAAGPGPASGSAAAAAELPTGAGWPLVSLVTANGLQTHAGAHASCSLTEFQPTCPNSSAPAELPPTASHPLHPLPLPPPCSGPGRSGGTA